MAQRVVRDDVGLVAVRAAYAALLLGLVFGLILATRVLSGDAGSRPATVAGVLALDIPGVDSDRRRAEAAAVSVARCMTRHGFAWVPWVEPPPLLPDADLGPVEWASKWGFGISTTVGRPPPSVLPDPNLAELGEIGPDERAALRGALYGDGRRPGCEARATTEVYGLRERALVSLRSALGELDARIAADPAAARVVAAWETCVRHVAGGLRLDGRLPAALMTRVSNRLAALGTTPPTLGGLAAIQAEERRVATVLAECEAAAARDRTEVAAPYEAGFVAEHRDELERVGAAIRKAEAAWPMLSP